MTYLNDLRDMTNFTFTENGAITHMTSKSDLLDLFAMGGAYRNRSDEDCIDLFFNAYKENPTYALKCLFYLRDIRGGQGERRFFRTCLQYLVKQDPDAVARNLRHIPEYGRWDDLFCLAHTEVWARVVAMIQGQLDLDINCKVPSLLAKWMPSENASSQEGKALARYFAAVFNMTPRNYRKMLSALRSRINLVETLMTEGRWGEIQYDKIPSKAGLKYKNAFARHDWERYAKFMTVEKTAVNAAVLNPVEIAREIFQSHGASDLERAVWQKYWDNLKDYYGGREERGIAVVDVSGSMYGTPLYAAVSMGAYIAERGKGPFQDHFITFSERPELVRFTGTDIYDKFHRAERASWGCNTDLKAVFDLLLHTAKQNGTPADEMPQTLYIFSDMEFDQALIENGSEVGIWGWRRNINYVKNPETLCESIAKEWAEEGYELPRVIFWNLDARQNNIPAIGGRFSYCSGFSMSAIEAVLSGKDGYDLMMEVLDSERYARIK